MYCTRKITEDISYIGGSDRRLSLFENMYPVPNGVSYNAYFLDDEKIAILDTVDKSIMEQYLENIDFLLTTALRSVRFARNIRRCRSSAPQKLRRLSGSFTTPSLPRAACRSKRATPSL